MDIENKEKINVTGNLLGFCYIIFIFFHQLILVIQFIKSIVLLNCINYFSLFFNVYDKRVIINKKLNFI